MTNESLQYSTDESDRDDLGLSRKVSLIGGWIYGRWSSACLEAGTSFLAEWEIAFLVIDLGFFNILSILF